MNKLYHSGWLTLLLSFILCLPAQATTQIKIGTGGVSGVYHPVGGAICRMINKNRRQHGIRCSVKSTGGSVYNLKAIRAGALDMGMAQSDWQYYAYQGTNRFASQGANPKLRAVFSVHSEPFTLITHSNSGIDKLQDLKGKRVNVGARGSGQRGTIDILMKALKWTFNDFELASELPTSEQVNALCNNKLDAIIVTVGHPSNLVKQASETCDAKVVAVEDPAVEKLVSKNPYYRIATIPGGLYKNNPTDLPTFGVGATFVTSTDVAEQTVYDIAKSVFENLDDFKALHPAFAYLKPQEMVQDALSAPLHDGANRYYQEAGIACYQTTPSAQNEHCESHVTDNDSTTNSQILVIKDDTDTEIDLDPPLPE